MQSYWLVHQHNVERNEGNMSINKFWYGLPNDLTKIDAAYENPKSGATVFFTGKVDSCDSHQSALYTSLMELPPLQFFVVGISNILAELQCLLQHIFLPQVDDTTSFKATGYLITIHLRAGL